MATTYKLFNADDTSANENAIVNLPTGRAIYKITGAKPHEKKENGDFSIVFNFTNAAGERFTHFVPIGGPAMNPDRARIGRGLNKAIWEAAKLGGDATIERLPNFVGKFVDMNVTAGKENGSGGHYPPSVGPVNPATGFDGAASAPKAAEVLNSPDDQMPDDPAPTSSQENPLEETPAATPETSAPKRWAKRK